MPNSEDNAPKAPRKSRLVGIGLITLFFFATFIGLGAWQIERLSWKLDLIARVDARVHAPAVSVPDEGGWKAVNAANDEYRHVIASGRFLNDRSALVYASTERGPGFWVLTPLQLDSGAILYVNRGWVPTDRKDASSRPEADLTGPVQVTGLMRITEPGGTFLRSNDPADGRWYSRDVIAMGEKAGLSRVAPFFIDADDTPNPGGLPVGGLTIVRFPNSHLSYALTWFAMAALSLVGGAILIRAERRR
ncbi:SURF1 family protein [Rhizobium sp. C4]|uniref:SURF1 family protein n=1 Tax=Rhizobium sp. C4 TaxID=1349800 RepID=UPI003FA7B239